MQWKLKKAGGALELGGFGIGGCRVVVCVSRCLINRDGDTKAFPIKYNNSYLSKCVLMSYTMMLLSAQTRASCAEIKGDELNVGFSGVSTLSRSA